MTIEELELLRATLLAAIEKLKSLHEEHVGE